MTREEAINLLADMDSDKYTAKEAVALTMAIKALEQESCEMTAEEYRQRMIQAFHNADCDELIAICVLPTEKEFEHLEWLLEKHYKAKPEPCEDAISRQAAIDAFERFIHELGIEDEPYNYGEMALSVQNVPPVTPAEKVGRWIDDKCSVCGKGIEDLIDSHEWYRNEQPNFCPFCGVKLVDSQESEVEE